MNKDYFIGLPHLQDIIDFDSLLENYSWDPEKDWGWKGLGCFEVFTDQPEMKNFVEKYHESEHYSSPPRYWLSYSPVGVKLWPHIDETRDAALIFPISPESHTVHFLSDVNDENSIIHSHEYSCPGLPNSKIPHCAHDGDFERYFLQVSLYIKDYSWQNLSKLVYENNLFAP